MPFLPTRGGIYCDLAAADGLLTSEGTVYPLLNRLRTQVWSAAARQRARASQAVLLHHRRRAAEPGGFPFRMGTVLWNG